MVLLKFMYRAFEQALSMKRALYKFDTITTTKLLKPIGWGFPVRYVVINLSKYESYICNRYGLL